MAWENRNNQNMWRWRIWPVFLPAENCLYGISQNLAFCVSNLAISWKKSRFFPDLNFIVQPSALQRLVIKPSVIDLSTLSTNKQVHTTIRYMHIQSLKCHTLQHVHRTDQSRVWDQENSCTCKIWWKKPLAIASRHYENGHGQGKVPPFDKMCHIW